MDSLVAIIRCFVANATRAKVESITEDFSSIAFEVKSRSVHIPIGAELKAEFAKLSSRDVLTLDLIIQQNDPVIFHSNRLDKIDDAIKSANGILGVAGASAECRLKLTVDKVFSGGVLTVYSFPDFARTWQSLEVKSLLSTISDFFTNADHLRFECHDLDVNFGSSTISFCRVSSSPTVPAVGPARAELLEKRNELCHFENAAEVRTIPDDFLISSRTQKLLGPLFERLCVLNSIFYIADIARIDDTDTVELKVKGYKTVSYKSAAKEMPGQSATVLFKIYKWVYEGGGASDKVSLARNLITLYAKNQNFLDMGEDLFNSIASGYQIYLRKNVEQYIQIKNKLIEFLTEQSKKAAKLGEDLGNTLAKNFAGFVTFFLSVLVVKAIGNNDFTGSFSPNVASIAYALLSASAIHLIASVIMLNREIKIMEGGYANIRRRYSDLLDEKDLDGVFNKDDEYKLTIEHIKFKRLLFGLAWVCYIVIFSGLVYSLREGDKNAGSQNTGATNLQSSFTITNPAQASTANPSTNVPAHIGAQP